MPKRRKEESETEYLKRKLRKIEKKLMKLPSTPHEITRPPIEIRSPGLTPPRPPPLSRNPDKAEEVIEIEKSITDAEDLVIEDEALPEDILLALGTEGAEEEVRGPNIREEVVNRWTKIMTTGLGKEIKDKIISKYPAPANFCKEAPKINPEILASLSEVSQKRDKRIILRQNLTLKAMTALGNTLTSVLKGNINSNSIVEVVNDAAKLLAEVYYEDSCSRKFFALAGANPTIKEAVQDTKPDEFLFGKDCADKIKAAQAIKKTSSQIKNPEQPLNKKVTVKPPPQQKKQGNWKGPSQQFQQFNQRTRGGHRQPLRRYNQTHQRDQKRPQHRSRHTNRR